MRRRVVHGTAALAGASLAPALLLPAPAFSVTVAQHLLQMFHLQDLNQLYTVVFCVWFLLLGAIEFFVIRFVWRRWFRG